MNRPEAERLLGGYAAGILSDSEKRTLFAAALEHQGLFDALLDEEALRELLADPEARQRLLAVLSPPAVRKSRMLWRRPAFIGLAASLFALVTTSLVVLRRQYSQPQQVLAGVQGDTGSLPSRSEAQPQSKLEAAPYRDTSSLPAGPAKAKAPAEARSPVQAQPPEPKAVPMAVDARAEGEISAEILDSAPNLAKVPAPSLSAEPAGRMAKKSRDAKQAKGPEQAGAGFALQMADPFECTLERLPGGRARLKVIWGPQGHLYVLKRSPSGPAVIASREAPSGKPGARTTLFELALGEEDALDVYVLWEPEAHPESLPAIGAVQGERRRVFPE